MEAYRRRDDGLEIFVRLTPKSSADRIDSITEDAEGRRRLRARVRAVPENGKANRAFEKLLAKHLGVAKSDVSVVFGLTSRNKTVRVKGDPEMLAERLKG